MPEAKYYDEKANKRSQKYQSNHIRQIKFGFSIELDADILTQLDSVPNKQGYIKELIRADIAARAKSEPADQPMDYQRGPVSSVPYFDHDPSRITFNAEESAQNPDSAK